jgi:hypothetical protein
VSTSVVTTVKSNQITALDAAMRLVFRVESRKRGASEFNRSASLILRRLLIRASSCAYAIRRNSARRLRSGLSSHARIRPQNAAPGERFTLNSLSGFPATAGENPAPTAIQQSRRATTKGSFC